MTKIVDIPKLCNKKRSVHGILLLDKPYQWTSNDAVQIIKRLYCAEKVGHTGSLDPLATGMLPICLGAATKISNLLLNADKVYRVTCKLGARTASYDAETPEIETHPVPDYSKTDWLALLKNFTGVLEQIPPMYSALKKEGKPLYLLAQQGKTIERKARQIEIFRLEYLEHSTTHLSLEVHCSKGTYIRTLIDDIGQAVGCGAYVTALRRLSVAQLPQKMLTWDRLIQSDNIETLDALLYSVDLVLQDRPAVYVSSALAHYLMQGQAVLVPKAPSQGEVRLYQESPYKFIGLGIILEDGRVAPKRIFNL